MPPLTPQITLNANLDSSVGGASLAGYLRVTLCGYSLEIPAVPGTCMLADAGVPQLVGPQAGSTPISIQLWGNDVIAPAGTFYEISVLDQNKDVIQSGMYQFAGSGTFDLSQVVQFVPPYGFPLANLAYLPCTGAGTDWTAPGPVIAVTYNGVLIPEGAFDVKSWTPATGNSFTLNFNPDPQDRIDALCVV